LTDQDSILFILTKLNFQIRVSFVCCLDLILKADGSLNHWLGGISGVDGGLSGCNLGGKGGCFSGGFLSYCISGTVCLVGCIEECLDIFQG
jgi:hypothetical protein